MKMQMSKAILVAVMGLLVQGCVQPVAVVPQHGTVVMGQVPAQGPVYVQQPVMVVPHPGVVYVAPAYPAPAVGFIWEFHPRYGWGWRHPQRGWHRGWR